MRALAEPSTKAEAAEIVRSQTERIALTPKDEGAVDVQLYGALARILELCSGHHRIVRP